MMRRPLIGATVMTVTTTTIAIRVGRRPRHGRLLKVNVRSGGDGGDDFDLRVGLRTIVDGRGRHCVKSKRVVKRRAGKAVVSD